MKRLFFFSTRNDIIPVLQQFERQAPLKFVETGTKSNPNRPIYLDSCNLPDIGVATHETASLSKGYMVSLRETKNTTAVSTTKRGEKRWDLLECDNDEAITVGLGGLWKTGTLLPGDASTLHDTAPAQQLMKWFLKALKSETFTKVGIYWVGNEAMEMLKAGKRLATTAEQSPPEFDLKLPQV